MAKETWVCVPGGYYGLAHSLGLTFEGKSTHLGGPVAGSRYEIAKPEGTAAALSRAVASVPSPPPSSKNYHQPASSPRWTPSNADPLPARAWPTTVHEAGHAVVGWVRGVPTERIEITSNSDGDRGIVHFDDLEASGPITRAQIIYGGVVAVDEVCGAEANFRMNRDADAYELFALQLDSFDRKQCEQAARLIVGRNRPAILRLANALMRQPQMTGAAARAAAGGVVRF